MNNKLIEQLKNKTAEAKRAKREAKLIYKKTRRAYKLAKDNLRHAKTLAKSQQLLDARRGLVDDMLKNSKSERPAKRIKIEQQ